MPACPLCRDAGSFRATETPDRRSCLLCGRCRLIFVRPEFRPDRREEEARYRLHDSGPDNEGYLTFLRQAVEPALPYLAAGMHGLDFGCGPGPAIASLLEPDGIRCEKYDPFFFPDPPRGPFDFIFATECFEHFFSPAQEIARISRLLKPGAVLTVMTEKWTTPELFPRWHYAGDRTHVSFYHERTFTFICDRFGFSPLNSTGPRVMVMRKTGRQRGNR